MGFKQIIKSFHFDKAMNIEANMQVKSSQNEMLMNFSNSKTCNVDFMNDAARIWNSAPLKLKTCKKLISLKGEIKIYAIGHIH